MTTATNLPAYPTATIGQRAHLAAHLALEVTLVARGIISLTALGPSTYPREAVNVHLADMPHRPDLVDLARAFDLPLPEYAAHPTDAGTHHYWRMGPVSVVWFDPTGTVDVDPVPVGMVERIDRALGRVTHLTDDEVVTCIGCGLDVPLADTVETGDDQHTCKVCTGQQPDEIDL